MNNNWRALAIKPVAGFFFSFFTDDFWRDYNAFLENGVHFVRPPKEEPYGVVAVFADLYGNLWDLIQPEKDIKGVVK